MSTADGFREEIVSRIRSCLISTKGRSTLRQLEDDYRTLLGERIPYQKLGHKTLEAFIQSIPSIITSRGPNGEMFIDAQTNEKTAHISSMVQKQKSSGPKKRPRIVPQHNFHRAMSQPPTTSNWRPERNQFVAEAKRKHENRPRLAAVSQNQFVSRGGYRKPKVASKVVVPEQSEFNVKRASPPKELRRYNSFPDKIVTNGSSLEDDCSPLSSTMKRITRIMSGINMERDSGNSSPTTEYAATNKEFTKTGDPIQDLRNFAAYHQLGDVEVKFTETKSRKSKVTQCHCKITVGQHKYSNYPEDFFKKEDAERRASEKALDDLMVKYSKRKSLLLSSVEDIIERIPPMLEKHNNAVWMWQIEADYIDKYNEQLPQDWLKIVDNSPYVSLERCIGGYVLKHCNPDDKGKELNVSLNLGEVSVPCNTVDVGEENRLFGVVTAVYSVNEIWCQQYGESYDRFVRMNQEMEAFYNTHKNEYGVTTVNARSCYVVDHEVGWVRVRALEKPHDDVVLCFFIDYGDEEYIPISNIYSMKREFALEQAQAFLCRLHGLEEFHEASIDSYHIKNLCSREVVLELVDEEGVENDTTTPVCTVMYDPNNSTSINEELITLLTMDLAMPDLARSLFPTVYVSNIESNGDVYVQVRSFGYHRLMEMLKTLSDNIGFATPSTTPTKENNHKKMYLIKDKISQKWLRATIMDWAPKGEFAQVYFVDVGHTQIINVRKEIMYSLETLHDVVSQYPRQAVKVRIMLEKIPTDFVKVAEKLLPPDQPVLLKITSYDNEKVPWVEFFKRTEDDVLLFINKSISVEAEIQSSDVDKTVTSNDTRRRRNNFEEFGHASKTVPSGGTLKMPDLPKIGAYFNVNIPFAVNPWNFFVQPLDSFNRLTDLMADMQEYYKDVQFSPPQFDDIVPGKIYASMHEDGLWYRTSVLKVINSGSISVFYCDFGYYTNLTLAQLVPLDVKYTRLPYQALKAKLSGIKPSKNKWTMEDCDFFNGLVTKQKFVSILVDIKKDELYKSDIVLQLLLIDTSSSEDVNIKEVLIQRGIATSV